MLHQVGVSFDLYYDARKHKIKKKTANITIKVLRAIFHNCDKSRYDFGHLQGVNIGKACVKNMDGLLNTISCVHKISGGVIFFVVAMQNWLFRCGSYSILDFYSSS